MINMEEILKVVNLARELGKFEGAKDHYDLHLHDTILTKIINAKKRLLEKTLKKMEEKE